MLKYKHILVAVDLSDYTDKILATAKELTVDNDHAKISLIHVIEGSTAALGGEIMMPMNINFEQSIENHVRKQMQRLAKANDISEKDFYIEVGSVKHAVNEIAEKISADLILVGTHGHHGIERLIGSRANGILHLAKVDVLAIRVAN
ncbi:MAG: hypothetical protein A3F17_04845 [Gammaproteobacteria bacterium RIFCSPHIGHO2_12_FULL_41_15]|nr:MAG: hypothetical protein A3F17_04845 [Gammaproteobacteria bacterium RIFCSPHIGHO2_12_FULL_41_15]